jgi:hypothetical protein
MLTAGSQVYGGLAQNAQAKYEARVADRNAAMERAAIQEARAQGQREQAQHWRRVSQSEGDQRVRQAASGVEVNFGSSADLLEDVRMIGAEDSRTIAENTNRTVRNYDVNASNYVMQGRAARSRGRGALVGSLIGAGSTVLGGARSMSAMRSRRANAQAGD